MDTFTTAFVDGLGLGVTLLMWLGAVGAAAAAYRWLAGRA